jgi:RimJ/RimL family protein N-acetyltransferase
MPVHEKAIVVQMIKYNKINYIVTRADKKNQKLCGLPNGLIFRTWKPGFYSWTPPGMGFFFVFWSTFHWLSIFQNRNYCVVYILKQGRVVHRSCVVPTYFRWPFMAENDLQISSTWTAPDWRGQGLATYALMYIVKSMSASNRQFWYVTRDANIPSIKVAQKAGFKVVGNAVRVKRFGSDLLGYLRMIDR